jgi:spoIIIJ-associated protein
VNDTLHVEATGETVGEAKWHALRELEKLHPALDRNAVAFEVLSEGKRGLLGVGYAPARVAARVDAAAVPAHAGETPLAAEVRELLEHVAAGIGIACRIDVREDDDAVTAAFHAPDLGILIGRHGQTIDAIQYLANAIIGRDADERKPIVVDAGGYRERRTATLESLALRSAEHAVASGRPVDLEPMSPVERKVVHLRLQDFPGVETRSEGTEPNRYVVVVPSGA